MASAASAVSAKPAESAKAAALKARIANLEEQIETISTSEIFKQNNESILAQEANIKDILRECGQDEKKKEMRKDELLELLKKKKRLQTLNNASIQPFKDLHFNLLTQLWNETKTPELAEKLRNVLEERKSAKDKSVSVTAGPAEGGKRRKSTTRKQKGRRATKKQNKNKKSRKQ